MNTTLRILAIDLGTSRVKVGLIDEHLATIATSSKTYPTLTYGPGMAEKWKFITDRSQDMGFRLNAYDKDVTSHYEALLTDSRYTAFQKAAQHYGHIAISYLDLGSAAPSWEATESGRTIVCIRLPPYPAPPCAVAHSFKRSAIGAPSRRSLAKLCPAASPQGFGSLAPRSRTQTRGAES